MFHAHGNSYAYADVFHAHGNPYAYSNGFHAHGDSYAYTDVFSVIGRRETVESICELQPCNCPPGLTLRQLCSPVSAEDPMVARRCDRE